jgi:hypothetical protein
MSTRSIEFLTFCLILASHFVHQIYLRKKVRNGSASCLSRYGGKLPFRGSHEQRMAIAPFRVTVTAAPKLGAGAPFCLNIYRTYRRRSFRIRQSRSQSGVTSGYQCSMCGQHHDDLLTDQAYKHPMRSGLSPSAIPGSRPSMWCKFGCGHRAAFSGGLRCNL